MTDQQQTSAAQQTIAQMEAVLSQQASLAKQQKFDEIIPLSDKVMSLVDQAKDLDKPIPPDLKKRLKLVSRLHENLLATLTHGKNDLREELSKLRRAKSTLKSYRHRPTTPRQLAVG